MNNNLSSITSNSTYLIPEPKGFKYDIFNKIPIIKTMAKSRYFQYILMVPNFFVFYVIIIAGFIGTPIGNRNIAIVVLWILWWFILIALLVPLFARFWCTMCPLPIFGDFLQRFSFLKVRLGKTGYLRNKMFGLNKVWPKRFKNIWIPNFTFLTLCTFSAVLVTRPFVTSIVLGSMVLIATFLAMIYRLRVFCGYICPVSGFIGLYSKTSTLELRSTNEEVCKKCKDKGCLRGNEKGWGCPWGEDMGVMKRNNYCGLCMECVKTCPNDNISLNIRSFSSETKIKGYDESWKGFIDVGTSHAYSLIYLGTNGTLKDWVNAPESGNWTGFFIYVISLWGLSLLIIPAIFYLLSYITKKVAKVQTVSIKEIFKAYSYILLPVGLLAWMAFSFPLIFVNGSYILNVISDPLGWGWDLFGTAEVQWQPLIPEYLGYIQIFLLLLGLGYSIYRGFFIGQRLFNSAVIALKALIPFAVLASIIAVAFILFFIG